MRTCAPPEGSRGSRFCRNLSSFIEQYKHIAYPLALMSYNKVVGPESPANAIGINEHACQDTVVTAL